LNEEIKEIRRMMSRSVAETTSEEEMSRGEPAIAATITTKQWSRWIAPENFLGSRWILIAMMGSS
jgi:hypothetical protein